jgi:nitroreductase
MYDNDNASEAAGDAIGATLAHRFGEQFKVDPTWHGLDRLAALAARRVQRRYHSRPIEPALLRLLCACALSAPSKSDLQQADILIVRDRSRHDAIADLLPDMPWVRTAPAFLVFLANGRRVPSIAAMREKPFPNDHLDAFFNATVDAALVLATFMTAANAAGLGCCPISVIRNHSREVSDLLELPDRVVPIAGMTVGWPADAGYVSPRLPLAVTVHEDRYDDHAFEREVDGYDRRRAGIHAFRPRDPERWGQKEFYGWSEDKARQYAEAQRTDFGDFVRSKGFRLE